VHGCANEGPLDEAALRFDRDANQKNLIGEAA
jgi:hypothetical protein